MALGSTQSLAEMTTRDLSGRPARKVDLTPASVSRLYTKFGNLDVSQPYGTSWPVTEMDLPLP
jgi:hypothetical protein